MNGIPFQVKAVPAPACTAHTLGESILTNMDTLDKLPDRWGNALLSRCSEGTDRLLNTEVTHDG